MQNAKHVKLLIIRRARTPDRRGNARGVTRRPGFRHRDQLVQRQGRPRHLGAALVTCLHRAALRPQHVHLARADVPVRHPRGGR